MKHNADLFCSNMNYGSIPFLVEWCASRTVTSQGGTKPLEPAKAFLIGKKKKKENTLQERQGCGRGIGSELIGVGGANQASWWV